jgi:hypothetical protein
MLETSYNDVTEDRRHGIYSSSGEKQLHLRLCVQFQLESDATGMMSSGTFMCGRSWKRRFGKYIAAIFKLPQDDRIPLLFYRGISVDWPLKWIVSWGRRTLPSGILNFVRHEWRMASSGMLRRVAKVRSEFSEELNAFLIRVTRIGGLVTTLAVISNRSTLRRIAFLLSISSQRASVANYS